MTQIVRIIADLFTKIKIKGLWN